jgi:hypothetical protein
MDWRDVDYPTAAVIVVVVVTGAALFVGLSTSAAAYGPYNYQWDGGAEFRTTVAAASGSASIARSTTAYEEADAGDSVAVVVSPTRTYRPSEAARVRQFVSRGGTLVVAADDASNANPLLESVGLETRLNGSALRDEQQYYRGPALPEASNVSAHPLTAGVSQLTLNHGTVLDVPRPGPEERFSAVGPDGRAVRVLVRSSRFSYLDRNGNETLDDNESLESYPVAALESRGEGRVVILSDASVLTNAMLEREGNRVFVQNVAGNASSAILDYSHGRALPPLSLALLVLRDTPALQALVGLLGLAPLVLFGRGHLGWPPTIVASLGRREREEPPATRRGDPAELAASLERRHPEWDRERIERVSQTLYGSDDSDQ